MSEILVNEHVENLVKLISESLEKNYLIFVLKRNSDNNVWELSETESINQIAIKFFKRKEIKICDTGAFLVICAEDTIKTYLENIKRKIGLQGVKETYSEYIKFQPLIAVLNFSAKIEESLDFHDEEDFNNCKEKILEVLQHSPWISGVLLIYFASDSFKKRFISNPEAEITLTEKENDILSSLTRDSQ